MTQNKWVTDYVNADALSREVGENMIARLEWMTLQPEKVVNLGSKTGNAAELLKKRYPNTSILAIDTEIKLLQYANTIDSSIHWICSDFEKLPVVHSSVDLVFANLLFPWFGIKKILTECRRILRPGGLFLFSSLGPDSLLELQNDYAEKLIPHLVDMHHIGDELIHSGFADPVLDVEYLTLSYREITKLELELKMTNMLQKEAENLQLESDSEGAFPLTYEVIYGHAWARELQDEPGVFKIPLTQLMRGLNKPK